MLYSRSGCLGNNRNALLLSEFQLRFLHLSVHSLVSILTTLFHVPSADNKAAQIRQFYSQTCHTI
jgi:hypothetical protein